MSTEAIRNDRLILGMLRRFYLSIVLLFLCFASKSQTTSFVTVRGHQFFLNGKPYYYIGTNYWYGGLLGTESEKKKGKERLQKELDFLHRNGVDNLRVMVGAEGSGMINGIQRVQPPLQPEKGQFNEQVLEGLDLLLSEMAKRNMKAVLFLSNNWEWSGGFLQYLNWNGQLSDSLLRNKMEWEDMRDYISRFYSCDACKEDYNKQVRLVLNHVNQLTKRKYTDEPAIMAWELVNEPRPMRPAANEDYKKWIADVAALIKSIDKNHLVTLGHEGEIGTQSMELYEAVHTDKNVDYLTIHIWPKNWGWFKDTSIAKDMQSVFANTNDYIRKHETLARKLNKPLVVEEFGLPRNQQSFDIHSSTSLREQYFQDIFSEWLRSRNADDVLGGCSFWAFGGTARSVKGQVYWKKGDDYMGDPPMEEQGLNTVFDSDKSTWDMIRRFAKQKQVKK
jgi:mannan endo-1,4-beta-mannosidase